MSRHKRWTISAASGPAVAILLSALAACTTMSSCRTGTTEHLRAEVGHTSHSGLMVSVRDVDGNPVPSCVVAIGKHRIGGMTDSRGLARIMDIPPGKWMVSWRLSGYFVDSLRVDFKPGTEETLLVVLRGPEPERENPYESRR